MLKVLKAIGEIVRLAMSAETKCFEIVRFGETGIFVADKSYQMPVQTGDGLIDEG